MNGKLRRIRESGLNSTIPSNMIDTLNDVIMLGAPATILEYVSQQVEELSELVCTELFTTDNHRSGI